jgi:hypothetical protein
MYKLNTLSASCWTATYRICTADKLFLNVSQSASTKSCRILLNIVKAEKHQKKGNTVQFCCKTMDDEEWTDSEYLFWYALARKTTKSLV